MIFKARDNVDVIDVIKQMKDGIAEKCEINMHDFEENHDSGLKTLMLFKNFTRKENLDIRFMGFNGTLPKIRDYLRKCNSTK